uniref:RING-type E3 ubiquitin transferase n=1 Tax=Leersia perrieri TaxID=77586 RepID=A0A0D9WDU1_9ORYZ
MPSSSSSVAAAATAPSGCLPADQSCFALSSSSDVSPYTTSRRDGAATARACCTTASYVVVLGISFGSLLAILLILCLIRWYLVWRSARHNHNRHDGDTDDAVAGEAPGSAAKKPSSGLDADAIAALPVFSYRREEDSGVEEDEVECAVCLAVMADGEAARRLPRCAHLFHRGCVDVWLREHSTCPVCRADVVVTRQESSTSRALVASPAAAAAERDLEAQL